MDMSIQRFLALILFFGLTIHQELRAQLTLEHTYTGGASAYPNVGQVRTFMVNLEVDGYKYVKVNLSNATLTFYNLNHSVFKSFSFSSAADQNANATNTTSILYISQHLFDLDDQIEFMFVDFVSMGIGLGSQYVTQIINELNVVETTIMDAAPLVSVNVPQQQVPIYNTPQGTKLILSKQNGDALIYSLGGTLTTQIQELDPSFDLLSNAFPNPTQQFVTIPYQLPQGESSASIHLYNQQGQLIETYTVDATFSELIIETSNLKSGTYYYELQTKSGQAQRRKLIKI
jgi:hypothetical protein